MSYFSLHCHSEYSNLRMLDCTNKLQNLIDKAIELNLDGIALTDHECLSGWIKAIQRQKKLVDKGSSFKIFLGDEIYLVNSIEEVRDNYQGGGKTKFFHAILIAKDDIGGRQIREISSTAWDNSFFTGKMERVPIDKQQVESIIGNDKGHIIFSTACVGGELAWHILNNEPDECLEFIEWCEDVFLHDNVYLEMQPSDDPSQVRVNQVIISISSKLDLPFIITTDVHYLTADQKNVHEQYLKSRDSDEREVGDFYKTCYLMTEEEIHQWMDRQIGSDNVDIALENTRNIAKKIQFFDMAHDQVVPKVPVPEFELIHRFKEYYEKYPYLSKFAYSEDKHDRYFLYLIETGWINKEYTEDLPEEEIEKMVSRINDELEAVWESSENIRDKISNYYITALSIEDMMWDDSEDGGNSLVGVSRGSVAAFYTCYLIGLQQINSYKYNIPFWRHLDNY